ncbi:thiazole tautomerase TenI [Falsibacillus albus]|uniref:Thiazole tautomerase TenI n=2 Tax=Falsibacillus albus TaxID=2478915 RepID=A0A3L7JRG0_9BACI|nr:thiazole tautomerase TenI [Falsibacillus albus]
MTQFIQKASMIEPHVDYIHLREKQLSAKELMEAANGLKTIGIPFSKITINDRVDVAQAMGAEGVQLANHSLGADLVKRIFPALRVGRSVHSVDEAVEAEYAGADYVLFGHVFPSNSKRDLPARGLPALEKVVHSLKIPVIAIGGINPSNIAEVKKTGARGAAVMSGFWDSDDIEAVACAYRKGAM